MRDTLDYATFHELACDLGGRLLIRPDRLAKWRVVYPNAGDLEGFEHLGQVLILCTDGTEAYFHVGRDTIFHGHLKAFNGPVAKVYVWACDWDFVNHKRKVSVFKRADGTVTVIPRDKDMEEYREMHPSYARLGTLPEDLGYCAPQVRESLRAKSSTAASKARQILATL